MGVAGFFVFLKKNCPNILRTYLSFTPTTLCIDLNGVIHEACQKVYQYGNYKPLKKLNVHSNGQSLFDTPDTPVYKIINPKLNRQVYYEVGKIINNLIYKTKPSKKVLIMIDGVAGFGKMSQQRQRRYRSAIDETRVFDSSCISPGTEFMKHLSNYLDHNIRKQMTENLIYKNLDIIFSNDKVPGEGEHKLVNYLRKYAQLDETFVFCGLDADLVMLCLSAQNILENTPQFSILRDDKTYIDISLFRRYLEEELTWSFDCNLPQLINDFIFLCFFVGNDFLPHSPMIDIYEEGLDHLFDAYKKTCEEHNEHLINENLSINIKIFTCILKHLSQRENILLETTEEKKLIFPEKKEYYLKNFRDAKGVPRNDYSDIMNVCKSYITGMEWVIKYYVEGIPDWNWSYEYQYAPYAQELYECCLTQNVSATSFVKHSPVSPEYQLLCVLPPQSSYLLPKHLEDIMTKLSQMYPTEINIDMSAAKFDWQGIVLLPSLNLTELKIEYDKRNQNKKYNGSEYFYSHSTTTEKFSSFYGEFESKVSVRRISDR